MKRMIVAVLVACACGTVLADLVLRENWRAKGDVAHEGLTNGWAQTEPDGTMPVQMPLDGYLVTPNCGDIWLYRDFSVVVPEGARVFLECAGQQYLTTVWLNGERMGEHRGSCGQFYFDVTEHVKAGSVNRLTMNLCSPRGDFRVESNSARETPFWGRAPRVQTAPVIRMRGPVAIIDVATRPDPRSRQLALDVELDAVVAGPVKLEFQVREKGRDAVLVSACEQVEVPAGRSVQHVVLPAPTTAYRNWSPDDPTYYCITVRAPCEEVVAKAGFRELRVDENGYFTLNDRRIFFKSAHMCNYVPFASDIPDKLPRIHQTLLYLKTCGFNAIRYLMQGAHPEIIDLCDDIGLMVYEEHPMSWLKEAGRNARELFRESMAEIVRRDRNHPSFTVFGFMNETETVPAKVPFIEASRELLSEMRVLDPGILYLFGSGRWDRRLDWASAANPFSFVWDGWMGDEGEGQALPPLPETAKPGDELYGLGDFHRYPSHPLGTITRAKFDRVLHGRRRAVFVSESGMGSAVNIVNEYLRYDQDGVCRDCDYELAKRQVAQLRRAFDEYGLYSVWPTPEAMIQASQEFNALQRDKLTTMIRRHPEASGYSVTMAQDLGLRGEGLLETSGSFKRGTSDMLEEAMSDLRFCLTASNETVYVGSDLDLEIALSDIGVLKPDRVYPIAVRLTGPDGVVWKREFNVYASDSPVTNLFAGTISTTGCKPGRYALGAEILEGAHAECGTLDLTFVDPGQFGELKGRTIYSVNGVNPNVHDFFGRVGAELIETEIMNVPDKVAVLVGYRKLAAESVAKLVSVARSGGSVLFLQPEALAVNKETPHGLPLASAGKLKWTHNWLYHADSVVFDSLLTADVPSRRIFDQRFFGVTWGNAGFLGITAPDVPGVVSAYVGKGDKPGETECEIAVQLGAYRVGRGWMVLNTLRLDLGAGTPGADLLLRNMLRLKADPVTME